jgi:hypothetical protein
VSHGGYDQGYFANVTLLPQSGVAFAFLAASAAAPNAARAAALRLLDEADLLAKPAPPPAPALVEARAVVEQLLVGWDDALVTRAFDAGSLRFSFNLRLREEFQKLAQDHGACRADGEITAYGARHGEFRFLCERGVLRFDVLLLADGRLQNVQWTQEFPPEARAEAAAATLVQSLNAGAIPAGALFATSLDGARIEKTLRRLALDHANCKIERGRTEIERIPLKPAAKTHRYELACGARPLVLSFALEDATGRVKEFAAHPPRPADATCWQ